MHQCRMLNYKIKANSKIKFKYFDIFLNLIWSITKFVRLDDKKISNKSQLLIKLILTVRISRQIILFVKAIINIHVIGHCHELNLIHYGIETPNCRKKIYSIKIIYNSQNEHLNSHFGELSTFSFVGKLNPTLNEQI